MFKILNWFLVFLVEISFVFVSGLLLCCATILTGDGSYGDVTEHFHFKSFKKEK